ncbi:hypothetical protein XENOCAPTIV_023082 [Xenoophorus captivus]|uniref:Uncharacterized protein n=1 Tax=Xenoophorus captivus TaxID=1517983 RepID=A0ABV0QBY0_9TELE
MILSSCRCYADHQDGDKQQMKSGKIFHKVNKEEYYACVNPKSTTPHTFPPHSGNLEKYSAQQTSASIFRVCLINSEICYHSCLGSWGCTLGVALELQRKCSCST